ncbi:MAG: hypothetical protein H7A47_07620 [Verrucomicrobiales bacterium]|nr:hypothetical protein [Verrucomicrobiales bacterium]
MNLVQLTPGAGRMYCGNCLRDNALVRTLRQQGHTVTMVPLYLPLTLDEADESAATPIFFSGVNVYLDQKLPWFRERPEWVRKWFTGRGLLGGVGRFAARTRAEKAGDLALSMLREKPATGRAISKNSWAGCARNRRRTPSVSRTPCCSAWPTA